MLDMTLAEFIKGEYPNDHDIGVYVVNNGEPLYVGMSKDSIHNRWFYGSHHDHLLLNINNEWYGGTNLGWKIVDNLPQSLTWHIQLWPMVDCLKLFADDIAVLGWQVDRITVADMERFMIKHLNPTMNRIR